MEDTKVQIGDDCLLDLGVNSEWYISTLCYDNESVNVELRRKADRYSEWWRAERTEPNSNADQHFQGVESVETKRCEKCKHFKGYWEFPSPKRDGTFERFVECGIKECDHEPKDESQTEVLAQIHELYAEMEKLLRKSSAEIVSAIREQTDCQWK